VKDAHQRAVRTDDFDDLAEILAECERDVRALLRQHMDGPEPTEPSLMAARTGCRIIFQEDLTGIGIARTALRYAHSYSVERIKDYLQRPKVSESEIALLQTLWVELDTATKPADEITNSHEATEAEREEAVARLIARYRELLSQYHEKAKPVSPMAAELLLILEAGMARPVLPSDLLAQNNAVPLAFAAEKFAAGAELAGRRMEAYARALPLRTTLLPGESIDEYVKRAGQVGRTPGDGVNDQGSEPGIILGDALAESALLGREGVRIGDVIEVAIPRVYFVQGRPDGRATYVKFRVTGLFHSGLYEDNMGRIFCDFDQLASVLSDSEVSYFVGAKLKDYSIYEGARADPLKREVEAALRKAGVGASRVTVWEDEKRTLLEAVEREKTILSLIVGFIIVLAGVLILILVYQLVNEKVKDIGILKALGHSPWGIRSVFMFNALFIGLFGALIGVGLGMLLSENLNGIEDFVDRMVGVRLFPPDVYFLTYIPSVKGEALLRLALGIGAPVVLFSFGCGIMPAMIAARKDPVEALHYE
jgi:ABC-type lipoprotein release transport system permease subunit